MLIFIFFIILINSIFFRNEKKQIKKYVEADQKINGSSIQPILTHHPFDNFCKFPIPNIYAKDIYNAFFSERKRQLKCPIINFDHATMDSEGYIYIHSPDIESRKYEKSIYCKVIIIKGGLRQPEKGFTKDIFKEIKTIEAPKNVRFWVNSDNFMIRCFNSTRANEKVWEKPFAGIKYSHLPEDEITISNDLTSFGTHGNLLKKKEKIKNEKYSIDILGFDSTSRTMFMRHLPRTVETMNKLGYHFFYGYNKVADNSMVNLLPILVGDWDIAMKKPKHDASGDINIDSILPQHDNLDPTDLKFLWNMMEEKWGCESMFNEDISKKEYGLFTYYPGEFQPGFRIQPAQHYYRAYFLAVYENWKYAPCKDGDTVQKEFVNLWKRFANQYKNICHFGFSFITTLTHEDGSVLEILDEKLSEDLSSMHVSGALDNTLSIIMGDHGNRIEDIQWTYTGRIEERMPLMAIKLPKGFAQKYPDEYNNFIKNKYKLVGNFDIHKTLFDIATMRFGENKNKIEADTGRGISLFEKISNERTCYDNSIPENFCTCLVDVSTHLEPLKGFTKKDDEIQKKESMKIMIEWLKNETLDECVNIKSLKMDSEFSTLSLNQFARQDMRTKADLEQNAEKMSWNKEHNFVNHEFKVSGKYSNNFNLEMLVRTEYFYENDTYDLVFEPFITKPPSICNFVSLFDVCFCFQQFNNSQ